MHPLLEHRRSLAVYLALCLLGGLALAGAVAAPGPRALGLALLWALPVSGLFAVLAPSLYYVCRAQPLRASSWPQAVAHRLVAVTALAAGLAALGWVWAGTGGVSADRELLLPGFALGWGLMLLSVLAHDLLLALQAAQDAAAREAQARLLAREMELQVLRMQIDPHFLFNALNSISALTSIDAAAARAMSIDLAAFLRQTLALADRPRVRLDEELGLVRHFLAVEQHRLGDKLRHDIDADAASLSALLPPLSLQPLVENALKHGLRSLDAGGLVHLQARVREGWLHLSVRNPTGPTRDGGLGLGLKNLRARFAAQYGERARVHWAAGTEHFVVELSLPFEAAP